MKSLELASLAPGKYIVAVSGGVDSMVLLDILARQKELELIVAHFNHGIRGDADEDEELVRQTATAKNLAYIYDKVRLGAGASEATARHARYEFLQRAAKEHGAKIVTAHHEDDVLETAILNLLRGTGRKGLSSLQSTEEIIRPLLAVSKEKIRAHAQTHNVAWREDSTNADETYLRNYVRRNVVPRLGEAGRAKLLEKIAAAKRLNDEIDARLREELAAQPNARALRKSWFIELPYGVSLEVLAAFLRANNVGFDKKTLHRLVVAAKTQTPGKRIDANDGRQLYVGKTEVKLTTL
ncbi:MAG TPA: tRNA lysidine(34) synthetase TilS [Candidatus Saccharimonadales bacterium]